MNKHKSRLQRLLDKKEISPADFTMLDTLLNSQKKQNKLISLLFFIDNPFLYLNGVLAIALAIFVLITTSTIAWYGQFRFHGLLDHDEIPINKHAGIIAISIEVLIAWISISLAFLISAKISKATVLSIIDVFAYCGIAKFPYLIMGIILLIIKTYDPILFINSGNKLGLNSVIGYCWMMVFYFLYFWQLRLYYLALKESVIITQKLLWFSFIISIMTCEIFTLQFVSSFFIYSS